jgi:hypothetical protein
VKAGDIIAKSKSFDEANQVLYLRVDVIQGNVASGNYLVPQKTQNSFEYIPSMVRSSIDLEKEADLLLSIKPKFKQLGEKVSNLNKQGLY